MGIDIAFEKVQQFFTSLGVPWSWLFPVVVVILAVAFLVKPVCEGLAWIFGLARSAIKFFYRPFYNRETHDFVRVRKRFAQHLRYEVEKLNREADWNDFYYTELEAEVEIGPASDADVGNVPPLVSLNGIRSFIRNILRISLSGKIERNLVHAILRSKSRAFLIIGEPGSGKTVSLRHLFLALVERCANSNDKGTPLPVYLNLKRLNLGLEDATADRIHGWVVEELCAGQDRVVREFVESYFEQMLRDGLLFFLFDSFDEIPAVMDAAEGQEVAYRYAEALGRFLHSAHSCRGLVASRVHRAPKVFVGQRVVIRPLSNRRIRKALSKYLWQRPELAEQLSGELVRQRDDLLFFARNPFYLNLIVRYVKDAERPPERQYDLFEHFIQSRAQEDRQHLQHYGLTPQTLAEKASVLAFAMLSSTGVGLESDQQRIFEAVQLVNNAADVAQVKQLLDALNYSKLGRWHVESPTMGSFSFAHRRFHEYFAATYLLQHPESAPASNLTADDRWREVLALFCEVVPAAYLTPIFKAARSILLAQAEDPNTAPLHSQAIEVLRFLRDAFKSRSLDLPDDVRELCTAFIHEQLEHGDLLDQKIAIESVMLAETKAAPGLLETALYSDSEWLRTVAVRSCRTLGYLSREVGEAIRWHLLRQYLDLKVHRNFATYSVVLSWPAFLKPIRAFLKVLLAAAIVQYLVYGILLVGVVLSRFTFLPDLFAAALLAAFSFIARYLKPNSKRTLGSQPFIGILLSWLPMVTYRLLKSLSAPSTWVAFSVVVSFGLTNFLLDRWGRASRSFRSSVMESARRLVATSTTLVAQVRSGEWRRWKVWGEWKYWVVFVAFLAMFISAMWSVTEIGEISVPMLYLRFHPVVASLILLAWTVMALLFIAVLALTIGGLGLFMVELIRLGIDYTRLRAMYVLSNARPRSGAEAVQQLHSFRTEAGKTRFVHALRAWVPVGQDSQLLADEADLQKGTVRDALFELVEVWREAESK